jgi:hypothetical protein
MERGGARSRFNRGTVIRIAIVVLALPLAGVSLADTLAQVAGTVDPQKAHEIAPWNGLVAAKLAEQEMSISPSADLDSRPGRLASLALRQDATAADALNVIGMMAQASNQPDKARRTFAYALTLSRRELPSRIWAIEEAVWRGDIREALVNYDIALTTSRSAADVLFPVLGSAIAEPKIRAELLRVLDRNPVWERPLIKYLAASGSDPTATAALFRAGNRNVPVDDEDRVNLVNGLLAKGEVAAAWAYYATFRKGANRMRSRDPGFTSQLSTSSRFDWNTVDTPGISASPNGGLLDYSVAPGANGPMIEQAQYLPTGRYRLKTQRGAGSDMAETAADVRPYLKVTCSTGAELTRLSLPAGRASASVTFTVPPDCLWQSLQLVARSAASAIGTQGQVRYAGIAPERNEN